MRKAKGKIQIGVIGSDGSISREVKEIANRIGKDIAKAGAILVCGGRGGVMEAACRGAVEEGGITVGILPTYEKNKANPFVKIVIPSGMGYARNALVVAAADGVIAIEGSVGTLSEIALALNLGKPVIVIPSSGGVCATMPLKFTKNKSIIEVYKAEPEEAVELLLKILLPNKP